MGAPHPGASAVEPVAPKLLIYYGIPQGVNGLWDDGAAAELFAGFDLVVFGVGLQDRGHAYHDSTVAIVELMRAQRPEMRVFGYIDLSVDVTDLPIDAMRSQVRRWQGTGADAICFDLAGYSFGTSRARQNAMVDEVHGLGMGVMLNTDVPEHVLGSAVDERFNPSGAPPHVGAGDLFLLESWVVSTTVFASTGGYRWLVDARRLADTAVAYRDALGVRIAAVNSADYATTTPVERRAYFRMAEAMATAWNLDAYGFAPTGYSGVVPDVNVVDDFAFDPRYASYVTRGARHAVNPAVTEVTRPDVPLSVHIDVTTGSAGAPRPCEAHRASSGATSTASTSSSISVGPSRVTMRTRCDEPRTGWMRSTVSHRPRRRKRRPGPRSRTRTLCLIVTVASCSPPRRAPVSVPSPASRLWRASAT